MKSLIIFLLLVSVASAGDECVCLQSGKAICIREDGIHINNRSLPEPGHCPHCGAKGDKYGEVIESGAIYLCPNGHIYWEKN